MIPSINKDAIMIEKIRIKTIKFPNLINGVRFLPNVISRSIKPDSFLKSSIELIAIIGKTIIETLNIKIISLKK